MSRRSPHWIGRSLPASPAAARRVRADAHRVHGALDDLRDAFHAASPGLERLGRSLQNVRRSLDGTGGDLADLVKALHRDWRGRS